MGSELGNASGTLRNVDAIATPKQGEFHPGAPKTIPTANTVSDLFSRLALHI